MPFYLIMRSLSFEILVQKGKGKREEEEGGQK